MDIEYRIVWYATVEDGSTLTGRSLLHAKNEEEAIQKLVSQKAQEYRVKPQWVQVESVYPLSKNKS
ncbi:hypothetical protein [Peribacillus alkalitolerans]|uniref:hypothetical protein n=1 Tax=Peribacillus alkalitolerans TaxID=1550385 RepID=UPI0013D49BFE|nr:hypothetical protein [Peribacillus alkalitolerans]